MVRLHLIVNNNDQVLSRIPNFVFFDSYEG